MRDFRFRVAMALLLMLVFAACTTLTWQSQGIKENSSAGNEFPLIPQDHSVPPRGVARESDQFVDSIGVNFHLSDGKNYTAASLSRFVESGIRHVRGSLIRAMAKAANVKSMNANYGTKFMLFIGDPVSKGGFDDAMTGAQARDALISLGVGLVDAVGGTNEPENFHNAGMSRAQLVTYIRAHQTDIYNAIKGDPRTANLMVFSPAISIGGVGKMDRDLGNMNSIVDGTISHAYPRREAGGIHFPEDPTPALPGGPVLNALNTIGTLGTYSKPYMSTETGYPTQPVNPLFTNPEAVVGIYVPRLMLTLFSRGVWRSYLYEWYDSGTGGSDSQKNYGMVHTDFTPKPHFTAIRNILRLLKDPGARFATTPLNYTLSGNMANVQEVLLEKRDGSYYLAVWIGKELDLNNPTSTNLTLNLPQPMASIATARPNDTDTWTMVGSGSSVNLTVDEKVLLVKLVPSSPQDPME